MKVTLVRQWFWWILRCNEGLLEWDLPVRFFRKKAAKDAAKVLRVKL